MSSRRVAVIDIGSNSIKVLIVAREPSGMLTPLVHRTLDARISAGLSQAAPQLSETGMRRGVEAVTALLADTTPWAPDHIALVATSAVREAVNGREFAARVLNATGHKIRILTGEEEANLIGRGLTEDPSLQALRHFYVFDLGGGSLECLTFRDRRIEQAVSVPLGCVRLTEMFIRDPNQAFTSAAAEAIATHTRSVLAASGFKLSLAADAVAVGTGGTVATVRSMTGAREAVAFEQTSPVVTMAQLRTLLADLAARSLPERQRVPGLPPARADVFPTALATLIAVGETGGFSGYVNSLYNLRYGVAAEILA